MNNLKVSIAIALMLLASTPMFGQGATLGGSAKLGGSATLGAGAAATSTTWTGTQHVSTSNSCSGTSTTCTITVSSTCSGCVGLIGSNNNQATFYISSISGAGTWVVPTGCQNYASAIVGSVSCAYNLSESSGTTSIVVTWNATATSTPGLYYAEASWTGATPSLDGTPVGHYNGTSSASQAGGTISPFTGPSDFCLQTINIDGAQPSSINSSYNIMAVGSAGGNGGAAWIVNVASGTGPTWTLSATGFANVNAICID